MDDEQWTLQPPIMSNLSEACLAINKPPFTNTGPFSPLNKGDRHVQQMGLLREMELFLPV